MKNIDKWKLYTKALPSPDSFIEFGYYSMIAAALQRRVWTGPSYMPLFPNLYVVLCAEPGIGKSVVIKQIYDFLSFFKLRAPDYIKPAEKTKEGVKDEQGLKDGIAVQNYILAKGEESNKGNKYNPNSSVAKITPDPLLIPLAADTTTFEALIDSFTKSYAGIAFQKDDGTWGTYTHSSLCFCLEELSSLLKRNDENVPKLMLKTYDCGDYEKRTRNQGNDYIKKCCLNFIAGTTPSFMQDVFNDKILNDGFSSRAFFIYEYANRSSEIFIPELTIEQHIAQQELRIHILSLTKLYGQCTYSDPAKIYLENWWRAFPQAPKPNNSLKLKSYYSRKNIHVQKLAIAIHFGETVENMVIELDDVKTAMFMLDKAERNMHHALSFGEKNPLAIGSKDIVKYMKAQGKDIPVSFTELWIELERDLRKEELQECLDFLEGTCQISKNTKEKETFYRLINKEKESDK